MKPSNLIKNARLQKNWSQKQLADATGVTPSFISKIEANETFPSYERCMALASVLGLSLEELWTAVEKAQTETYHHRIRTRGAAIRTAIRTRGAPLSAGPSKSDEDAEEITKDLAADADLKAAYHDLKTALSDPKMRETVLNTLRALAQAARSDS